MDGALNPRRDHGRERRGRGGPGGRPLRIGAGQPPASRSERPAPRMDGPGGPGPLGGHPSQPGGPQDGAGLAPGGDRREPRMDARAGGPPAAGAEPQVGVGLDVDPRDSGCALLEVVAGSSGYAVYEVVGQPRSYHAALTCGWLIWAFLVPQLYAVA